MSQSRRGRTTCRSTSVAFLVAFALTYVGGDSHDAAHDPGSTESPGSWRSSNHRPFMLGTTASAQFGWGEDQDLDGLADEVERFLGANSSLADTDYDGYSDGVEWVLSSDLTDPDSLPDARPAIRSYAYESLGQIRVFCAVYPANLDFVSTFRLLVGSREFTEADEGDPGTGIGIYDVSGLIPLLAHSYTHTQYLGLELAAFNMDFDPSLLRESGPLNIAWAATIAGVEVVDQIYLGIEGTTSYLLAATPAMAGGGSDFTIQPLGPVPPLGDEVAEYCSIGLSDGTPVGLASVEFSVTTADCLPDGLLYCIDADCSALAGQTFILVDYGYLQSKAR